MIYSVEYTHPAFTSRSIAAQRRELRQLNGTNRTYFCGSYMRYGFHEDAGIPRVPQSPSPKSWG